MDHRVLVALNAGAHVMDCGREGAIVIHRVPDGRRTDRALLSSALSSLSLSLYTKYTFQKALYNKQTGTAMDEVVDERGLSVQDVTFSRHALERTCI